MKGKSRVKESVKSKIFIRFVEKEDEKDLLRWRNDPVTRMNSFNTDKILLKDHLAWFDKTIKNSDKNIFIGLNEKNEKIGMVRFDQEPASKTVEINIVVAPEARGKGYGTELLIKSCEVYFNNYHYNHIIAKIKKDNIPSIKAFTKAGFIQAESEGDYMILHLRRNNLE